MKSIRIATLILTTSFIVSCATTNKVEDFQKVKRGMEKADVVEILASPYRAYRVNDTDVWVYRFRENDSWQNREIHFRDGTVQFAGEPLTRERLTEGIVPPSK